MKTWRDLITEFQAEPNPRLHSCDPEDVARSLGISDIWHINHEAFDARFKSSALVSWTCTDTQVGLYVILLDGEVVGVGSQPFRKSDYEIKWLSSDVANRAKHVLISMIPPDIPDILDVDEVIDDWWFEQESG